MGEYNHLCQLNLNLSIYIVRSEGFSPPCNVSSTDFRLTSPPTPLLPLPALSTSPCPLLQGEGSRMKFILEREVDGVYSGEGSKAAIVSLFPPRLLGEGG